MGRRFVLLGGALAAWPAVAANLSDKPLIAPPAAWIVPAPLPADTVKPDEAAVRMMLEDQQVRLTTEGGDVYSEIVMRVQTPQGLAALGTVTLPWKPDTSTLTVHKIHVIRDGKVIDVLAGGTGFTVLRRENNLEYAALDGVLTAVIQPEGLQVGDVLDIATTVTVRDPVLAGHPEGALAGWPNLLIAHARARAVWDHGLPIRWRVTDGTPAVRERRIGSTTEISLAADDLAPLLYPKDAPARFRLPRMVEVSSFAGWSDLSALFAPLYAKAAMLKPGSPLKAEAASIAALSPDPARRAEAALALVQDRVRYVFLGMNDGGLVPADADLSWQRRFGDCKGKTVLLLALLRELGIEAVPAVVSTQFGDGMDQRLPMVGLFDHILVRTVIAGRVYWLDGTRTGDRRLADVIVPPFRWALPVRASGAVLERLEVAPASRPFATIDIKIDAIAGISRPAPMHAEAVLRGDPATAAKLGLANMTPEVRDRALRDYWTGTYDFATVKTASATYDDKAGEEHIVMDGTAAMDWSGNSYEADGMGIGWTADFTRPPGPHQDAPFAVAFPSYARTTETILLPNGGRGFKVDTPDVDRTVAGIDYHRKARLVGATYTVEMTSRSVAPEFPASEAAADQAALRALAKQRVFVNHVGGYIYTPQEKAAIVAGTPTTAQGFMDRAAAHYQLREWRAAIADYTRVVTLDPKRADAFAWRAESHAALSEETEALADAKRAIELEPSNSIARLCRARLLQTRGHSSEALVDVEQVLAGDPTNIQALGVRVSVDQALGRHDQLAADKAELARLGPAEVRAQVALSDGHGDQAIAILDEALATDADNTTLLSMRANAQESLARHDRALADSARAIRLKPDLIDLYLLRANIFSRMGQVDRALDEASAVSKANPDNDYAHLVAGATYARQHKAAEAEREFARAIAIKPSVAAYLTHGNARPLEDIAGRHADIEAARRLDPDDPAIAPEEIALDLRSKNYPGVIATSNAALKRTPDDAGMLTARGLAYLQSGKTEQAEADFAAARTATHGDATHLNGICWRKATLGLALESALLDCDAALKSSAEPNALDSRGFVLLRLRRFTEAIASYDDAISRRPRQAESLYGRGLAKLRSGRKADGEADIEAAKSIDAGVVAQFAGYGVIA